jgi:hypothetical protein
MPTNQPAPLLRNLLLFDAATCTAMGIALILAANPLAALTAIPATILFFAGVALLPSAAFMAMVATRAPDSRPAVWLIIVGNVLWVIASLWLITGGWIAPTALGQAFVAAQALAVAALALLEYTALRRTASTVLA